MEKWSVVHLYSGILFGNEKGWTSDTCYDMDKPEKYATWKKPDTKDYILYFISMKCPEKVSIQISGFLGVRAGLTTNGQE